MQLKQLASTLLKVTRKNLFQVSPSVDLTSSFKFRIFCFVLGSLSILVLSLDTSNSTVSSSHCTSAFAQAYMLKVSVSVSITIRRRYITVVQFLLTRHFGSIHLCWKGLIKPYSVFVEGYFSLPSTSSLKYSFVPMFISRRYHRCDMGW